MPTTFVLLRHAQGTHNANSFQKPTQYKDPVYLDAELTEEGLQQTLHTGKKLRNTKFDAIFCSPLRRCRSTLQGVLPQSIDLPVHIDDRLIEQDDVSYACNKRLEKHDILPTCPKAWNTERVSDVNPYTETPNRSEDLARIQDFTEEVLQTYPNHTVLIVSHCGWIQRWCKMYPKKVVHLANCQFVTDTVCNPMKN